MATEEKAAKGQYITIEETARLLRVAPSTVYRWCRSGKLLARKFGREWRVDRPSLESNQRQEARSIRPFDFLLPHMSAEGEHLLAFTPNDLVTHQLQSCFLETALEQPYAAVYVALWDETPQQAAARLRPCLAPHVKVGVKPNFIELGTRYEAGGLAAVIDELRSFMDQLANDGQVWIANSLQRFFGANIEPLIECENALHDLLEGRPVTMLCAYEHTQHRDQVMRSVFDLTGCHSGIMSYDGWHPPRLLRVINEPAIRSHRPSP